MYSMQLPAAFTEQTRLLLGDGRFERYLKAFDAEPPVSIRLNPLKAMDFHVADGEQVPWCPNGYYLNIRPNFTFDPLLHAGCYYVQEASSMFLDEVLRQWLPALTSIGETKLDDGEPASGTACRPLMALDLCAAPGGKSTILLSRVPAGSFLMSNEPNPKRADILAENIAKWGSDACFVTNNYPQHYRKSKLLFDIILCDVPCSGEGMFRKDAATIDQWSTDNVEKCWRLQRDIVGDAWQCLQPGGLMIYSTCTLNTKENEENIRWAMEELGAEPLSVQIKDEWGVTPSLLAGFDAPVYRFIPGLARGEGLFMCVMRKPGRLNASCIMPHSQKKPNSLKIPSVLKTVSTSLLQKDEPRGGVPDRVSSVPLTYSQAISYLRREAITLPPDAPRGVVGVSYEGQLLGYVKNIGNRANNLYPKEWRIKSTYLPEMPPKVIIKK